VDARAVAVSPDDAHAYTANPITDNVPTRAIVSDTRKEIIMQPKASIFDKRLWLIGGVGLLCGFLCLATHLMPRAGEALPETQKLAPQATPTAIPQPFPTTPPDASKITVGDPDIEGYATVTGAAGAVEPLARVVAINLNAWNVMTTTADASGGFAVTMYAPPGSSLQIKYETTTNLVKSFWDQAVSRDTLNTMEQINPLPGTILHIGAPPPGDGEKQSFHAVSAFLGNAGWAGLWLSGTLQVPPGGSPPGLSIQPGETMTITGRVRVTSEGMNCTAPPTYTLAIGDIVLRYLFDADGRPMPWDAQFNSYLFTPTGLPIEHETGGETYEVSTWNPLASLACIDTHVLEGHVTIAFAIPLDMPVGTYHPEGFFMGDVPTESGVPAAIVWFRNSDMMRGLPSFRIGDPAPPRIPWTLLADYPVNGHWGIQAREDVGRYALSTRVLFPPHRVVIPRLDERTGEPLSYRLEPGSFWLSGTDRRTPPPPIVPLDLPSGLMIVEVIKPWGDVDQLGPAVIAQSAMRTPTTPGGVDLHEGTGHVCDLYHLSTMSDAFAYVFDQYGQYVITVYGHVDDVYGNTYAIESTYDVTVARVLDLDPAQLPTTPYMQGDAFAPGVRIFPPVPAEVTVQVVEMPYSDPAQAIATTVAGPANRFGYFQPPAGTVVTMTAPGEFRVDITAVYAAPDGTLWAGYMTWGNVVEGPGARIVAHGRRGMDYESKVLTPTTWFENSYLLSQGLLGLENYYPYFSGDVHWGDETPERPIKGDSIHPIITVEDLTAHGTITGTIYDVLKFHYPRAKNKGRWPPFPMEGYDDLIKRIEIGEAQLFITTESGVDPVTDPEDIDLWGYWYGTSERPDVRVHELISEDGNATAYWRFNDTYAYQIGEPADGDQPGDIKWEFGGVVLRTITTDPLTEYAIYSSLWVLLPQYDPVGARVTAPFRGANGTSISGGPILTMTVEGQVQEIDMLFLPKGVRPGDVLEMGDVVAFSGHVGPPLDSLVTVTITSPSNVEHIAELRANKIGWVYDPGFDFEAYEPGRWTVDVQVVHDRDLVYAAGPFSNNTGTVMGTTGRYEFYVVEPGSLRLFVTSPQPGFITWPEGEIEPIHIRGFAPPGTTAVHYTIHDKGVVMGQGSVVPDAGGAFTVTYDAETLHESFSMLSLTAHDGRWEGLADEVAINLLATGGGPRANTVTLIGEEVFVGNALHQVYLPLTLKE
jgi:hypothetical protein